MRFAKKFELAWNTLIHSRLRSWLTIIGIIIGIGSVVAIVSISNGAQESMEESMNSFGADQITVSAGSSRAMGMGGGGFPGGGGFGGSSSSDDDEDDPELTNKDVLAVEAVDNVVTAAPSVSGSEEVIFSSKKSDVSITAIDAEDWEYFVEDDLASGRTLLGSDVYSVVVGGRVADGVFEDMTINRQLTIAGKIFKIVGILDDSSSSMYIPLDSAVGVLEDVEDGVYDSLTVIVEDSSLLNETTYAIEDALMLSRGILFDEDKDFSVSNQLSMQESIEETLSTMSLFLGSIAAISLLVGGIGIANTLFTSVLEKTREIGIMKAIGAKNGDILMIFLLNSGLIGLVGGWGGVIVGGGAAILVSSWAGLGLSSSGMGGGMRGGMSSMFGSSSVSWGLVVFALVFSVGIGMVAGVIPAWRASKLRPVDALRYE